MDAVPLPVDDRWAVALYDFAGNEERNILSIKAGDVVLVSPRDNKDWWPANLGGVSGFLPKDYLKLKPLEWTPRDLASLKSTRSSSVLDVGSEDGGAYEDGSHGQRENVLGKGMMLGRRQSSSRSFSRRWPRALSARSQSNDIGDGQNDQMRANQGEEDGAEDAVFAGGVEGADDDDGSLSEEEEEEEEEENDEHDHDDDDHDEDEDEEDELHLAVALFPFKSENPRQLSFDEGQELYVRPSPDLQWWFAELDGETGMIPYNYVQILEEQERAARELSSEADEADAAGTDGDENDLYVELDAVEGQSQAAMRRIPSETSGSHAAAFASEDEGHGDAEDEELAALHDSSEDVATEESGSIRRLPSRQSRRSSVQMDGSIAVCQYDFVGREPGELSFTKGDFLWVDAVEGIEWWTARNDYDGQAGIVPRNYLKLIKVEEVASISQKMAALSSDGEDMGENTDAWGNDGRNNYDAQSPGVRRGVKEPVSGKSSSPEGPPARPETGSPLEMARNLHLENLMFFITLRHGRADEDLAVLDVTQDSCPFELKVLRDGEVAQSERVQQEPTLTIVLKGHMDMSHREARLRSVRAGQWFGESIALDQGVTTPATYRTHGPCTVLRLTKANYANFQARAPGFAAELAHMARFRSNEVLGTLDIFSGLSQSSLRLLGPLFYFRKFQARDTIFQEGDVSRELYVIVHGRVQMSRDGHTVGEGQYFGEAAFLRGHPRTETATALEELVVIVLDSKDLASFIECVEEAAPIFSDFVWRKSAQALRQIPFFESVPRDKLEQIAHLCKYRTFATDEVIVRAGDPGTDFYVIESGRVRVEVPSDPAQMMAAAAATAMRGGNKSAYSRREELEARRRAFANSKGSPDDEHPMKYVYLGENEYFGEIAVLASEPRSATVRVMEGPCRCLILDGAAFRAFLTDCPQIKRDVVEKVTRRLRKASPEMRDSMKRSSRNLGSLTHMGASRDVRRSASRSSSVSSTFSSARSSVSSFRNEATEIEWITAPVESLASIPRGEDVMADQESIDAATVLFRVGETMGDCHLIYECWPIYVHPCSRPDLWGASTDVFIKLVGVDNQMRETTVKSHTDDTVADVVDKAFQMADKMGRNIDPAGGPNFFGLKVKSLNDFLVYREIPLRQYKYIAAKCLPGRRNHITLALVDLRRPPSSNGSGVHALSFLKQRSTPGRQNTSALEPAHGVPVHRRWASASAASSSLLPASSMSTSSSTTSNSTAAALAATASGPGPLKPPVPPGDTTKRRTLSHLPLGRPQLTKQNSRGSSRTLSADSGSSVSSQEMAPPAISFADVADNRGDVIPEDASLQVPPPPPLSSQADAPTNGEGIENEISVTMATPGKPSIAPEEFSKLMLSMTQESLAIKPTWDEVQRGQQSLCEGPWPLRVRIVGLEGLLSPPSAFAEMDHVLGLRVQLVYASRVLETREISHFFRFKAKAASVRLDQWVSFNTTMDHLPLTTRLCFTLYNAAAMSKVAVSSSGAGAGAGGLGTGASGANGSTPGPVSPLYSGPGSSMDLSMYAWSGNVSSQDLGPALAMAQMAPSQMPLDADHAVVAGASLQLFDQRHIFRAGSQSALLWPGKAEKHLACMNRFPEFQDQARLQLELDEFRKPLYFALPPPIRVNISGLRTPDPKGMRGRNFGESSDQAERNASNADASGSKQRKSRRGVGLSPKRTKKPSILTRFKLASGNSTSVAAGSTTSSEDGNGKDQLTSDRANPADQGGIRGRRMRRHGTKPLSRAEDLGIPNDVSQDTRRALLLDPVAFYKLSAEKLKPLWADRDKLVGLAYALPRVLFAADWCDPLQREMALEIAGQWQVPEPMEALELLDSCHGDLRVREYAVRCLEPLTDEDLGELLIQLTQAIKYEPYHESFLVRFLLRRAWQSPREIGTKLFWSLRSEMHNPRVRPRFGLILRVYLECASPAHRQDLSQEVDVQNLLKEVADAVQRQKGSSRADRHAFAQTELSKVSDQLPGSFQLCLDPRLVVRKLQVKECKVMNSKKKPLWLKFSSVDPAEGGGEPTLIMFKAGDDLRQDQMTLQMLRLMDKMWLGDGLDLCMTPYRCISTGNELGMIEVVTNSETTANIQKRHGKLGALSSRTLYEWLQDCNRGGSNFNDVRDRFVRSCAGYVVATYVLGIGDRHSDNIMLNRDGRLFHIDFGHFLGHFKSKYGVKRERTAFVFTKEMAAVMGGKNDKTFSEFVKLCCRAYNILRRHGNTLVNLFRLMVPAGMPELTSDDSILYLCQKLCLEMTEQEASESFKREIQSALGDTYRRFDNLIHNIKT